MRIGWHHRSAFAVILCSGFLFVGYILTLPKEGVFFSGDGGLKYLMLQNYSPVCPVELRGDESGSTQSHLAKGPALFRWSSSLSPVLNLPAPPEVRSLWHEGFYPLGPPYVYKIGHQYLFGLPLYFAVLSKPFYSWWGWQGLYVLPALGVFLSWLLFIHVGALIGFGIGIRSFLLAVFIFSSPVTLYAGMFWEHSLGVAFACLPLLFIVRVIRGKLSIRQAFGLGALAGLGVFLRPEILALVLVTNVSASFFMPRSLKKLALAFAVGSGLAVFAFFTANVTIDNQLLGLHARQIWEQGPLSWQRILGVIQITMVVSKNFVIFCPFLLPVIFGLGFIRHCPGHIRQAAVSALSILFLCALLIPWLLPDTGGKEWGPRYLLILVPWVFFLLGAVLEGLQATAQFRRQFVWGIGMGMTLVVGMYLHTYQGVRLLAEDYQQRILPAYRLLSLQSNRIVVVSHQWIALELATLFNEKNFLWVKSAEELTRLQGVLESQGNCAFLYVTYQNGRFRFLPLETMRMRPVGRSGSYEVFIIEHPDCHPAP